MFKSNCIALSSLFLLFFVSCDHRSLLEQLASLDAAVQTDQDGEITKIVFFLRAPSKILRELKYAKKLKKLSIRSCGCLDPCLDWIGELRELESLDLSYNAITDKGLLNLKKLNNLKYLNLETTKITDSAFKDIVLMKNLEVLNVTNTQFTREKINDLVKINTNILIQNENSIYRYK